MYLLFEYSKEKHKEIKEDNKKRDLLTIKTLLESIGIKANIIFTEKNGLDRIKKIPQAEYNIVVNPWLGVRAVEKLEEKYGTPFIKFPNVHHLVSKLFCRAFSLLFH